MNETASAVGEPIVTYEQMNEMPVGTVICEANNEDRAWRKMEDGFWHGIEGTGGRHSPSSFSMDGYNKVREWPGEAPPPPPPETLVQYQWKFRENALSGAHENGVSISATMEGLKMLGVSEPFPLGPGVRIKTLDVSLGLPENTVVGKAACNPDHDRYSLWVWRTGNWRALLGRSGLDRDVVIVEMPGVTETPSWWTEVGDEDSAQQIAEFKAKCWRIGSRIKSQQSWCATYESVIARVGVTARSITASAHSGFGVGEVVGQRNVARLPVNSLLLWTHALGSWAIYRRDDSMDNQTKTRRIFGHRAETTAPLSHYQAVMTVLAIPAVPSDEHATIDAHMVPAMLEQLPIGTVINYSGSLYVICRDRLLNTYLTGRQIPERGVHAPSAFRSATNTAFIDTVLGADA